MTLSPKRPILAAIFLFAIIVAFSACKKPEKQIGLEIQPEDDFLNVFLTDSTTIRAKTIIEDSLRTDKLSISLLGNYIDPVFGQSRSDIYTQVRISSNNIDFGNLDSLEVDSVILSLVYSDAVDTYGKIIPQYFSVNEITGDFSFDSSYYSNQKIELDNSNLIPSGQELRQIDLNSYVQLASDSMAPHLRIPLNNDLGVRFIEMAENGLMDDNTTFLEEFKGLNISSLTPDGAVLPFNLVDVDSKLTLFYRKTGDGADTLSFDFFINSNCARYSHLDHSFSSEISGISSDNSISGEEFCYIQGGASVKTKIEFPHLLEYNQFEGRTINKAELIMSIRNYDNRYDLLSELYLTITNDEGVEVDIPDALTFNHSIGGAYDVSEENYKFNITRYVQSVLNEEIPNDGLSVIANHAGVLVNRSVLIGTDSILSPDKNIKLILTFSN